MDTGEILYHAISEIKTNPYIYTMSCVKSAFDSLIDRIKKNSLYKHSSIKQDNSKEVRYSKKIEFNEDVIKKFYKKNIDLNKKKVDLSLYVNPFILKN